MKNLSSALVLCLLASYAQAQTYTLEQPMFTGGGVLRSSQLWVDPAGHDDCDNDALAWENFQFPAEVTVTKLRWWGETAPSLGFRIGFYHQDPGTIAVQPDIFGPNSHPISLREYTSFSQTSVGGALYRFEIDLVAPLTFSADTRYFVSVVGLTPIFNASWRWAQGTGGSYGTFWWQRGAHMYFHLGDDRALALEGFTSGSIGVPFCFGDGSANACPCANPGAPGEGCANSTGSGALLGATGQPTVGADTVVLSASQCPPTTPGLFFGGPNALTGLSFGDGLRCVGGNVVRLGVVTTSPSGTAASQVTLSVREGLNGGELRRYQYWFRDVSGPCGQGFNTTNGLRIQW